MNSFFAKQQCSGFDIEATALKLSYNLTNRRQITVSIIVHCGLIADQKFNDGLVQDAFDERLG